MQNFKDLEEYKRFKSFFETELERKVNLIFTENKTSLIRVKKNEKPLQIRIHKLFINADQKVLRDIVNFIKTGDKNTKELKKFIKNNHEVFHKSKKIKVNTKGKFYDLEEIFKYLNKHYFDNKITSSITWSKGKRNCSVKKRILGSYDSLNDIIKINPILDDEKIPAFYVDFIVYHEMLHAFLKNEDGRWHSKKFKEFEKKFNYYREAIKWEKNKRF